MKAKLLSTLVAAPLLALSTGAFAGQPVQLTPVQMDGVTAGGLANAQATALAVGSVAATLTVAQAGVQVNMSKTFEVTKINLVGSGSLAYSSSSAM